ncbi:MAG: ABC transporter permease [Salinarimonadaceae bacterium]|nr:MAG: ABC transporter permease [Salinarimonadaceae bacterium]
MRLRDLLLNIFVAVMAIIIIAPIALVLVTSFSGADFIRFPPDGFSFKHYVAAAGQRMFIDAFGTSVVVALSSATLALILGGMAAVGITRYDFPGRDVIQGFLVSPLMIPALVLGITLLHFYSAMRISTGIGTIIGGHMIVTIPYAVRLLTASLVGIDRRLELAAMSMGASPLKAFIGVTLPNVTAGLLGAFTFAAIMSFDDIGLALFISSSRNPTLPVAIFTYLDQTYDPMIIAVSSVMILVSVLAVFILDRAVGVSRIIMNAQAK